MLNEKIPEQIHQMTDQIAESTQAAIQSTQRAANATLDSLAEASHKLREGAVHASDTTARYIRNDPLKAVLIAAAAGAIAATVMAWATRSHHRG